MKYLITLLMLISTSAFAEGVTYTNDIRPIFSKACSTCHNGKIEGLPNLLDYQMAFTLRGAILRKVVIERSMPHLGYISESERDLIKLWIQTGAKN